MDTSIYEWHCSSLKQGTEFNDILGSTELAFNGHSRYIYDPIVLGGSSMMLEYFANDFLYMLVLESSMKSKNVTVLGLLWLTPIIISNNQAHQCPSFYGLALCKKLCSLTHFLLHDQTVSTSVVSEFSY